MSDIDYKEDIGESYGGVIKISDDVVASICGLAASEVKGVASMAGNITNEIVGKLGIKNSSKGVKIEIEDGKVIVDLFININYGVRIPVVTAEIQEKVKNSVENMTGLEVISVNIHIVEVIVSK